MHVIVLQITHSRQWRRRRGHLHVEEDVCPVRFVLHICLIFFLYSHVHHSMPSSEISIIISYAVRLVETSNTLLLMPARPLPPAAVAAAIDGDTDSGSAAAANPAAAALPVYCIQGAVSCHYDLVRSHCVIKFITSIYLLRPLAFSSSTNLHIGPRCFYSLPMSTYVFVANSLSDFLCNRVTAYVCELLCFARLKRARKKWSRDCTCCAVC